MASIINMAPLSRSPFLPQNWCTSELRGAWGCVDFSACWARGGPRGKWCSWFLWFIWILFLITGPYRGHSALTTTKWIVFPSTGLLLGPLTLVIPYPHPQVLWWKESTGNPAEGTCSPPPDPPPPSVIEPPAVLQVILAGNWSHLIVSPLHHWRPELRDPWAGLSRFPSVLLQSNFVCFFYSHWHPLIRWTLHSGISRGRNSWRLWSLKKCQAHAQRRPLILSLFD